MESDISLYTKTYMDWQQPTTKLLNETHCWQLYHNAIFAYSTWTTSAKQWYQPGGAMITSTRTIAACHLETGMDPTGMGWYSYQNITGMNGRKILFIVRYRVCKETISHCWGNHIIFSPMAWTNKTGTPTPKPDMTDRLWWLQRCATPMEGIYIYLTKWQKPRPLYQSIKDHQQRDRWYCQQNPPITPHDASDRPILM
jgi:hypothetical protein